MKKYLWLHQSDSVYCFYSDFTPGKLYPHDPSQWQSRLTFDKSDVEILLNNDVIMEVETVMHEDEEWIVEPVDIPQYDDSWNCDVEFKVMLGLEIVRFVPRADFELIRIPSTGQDSISDDSNCTAPAESLPEKASDCVSEMYPSPKPGGVTRVRHNSQGVLHKFIVDVMDDESWYLDGCYEYKDSRPLSPQEAAYAAKVAAMQKPEPEAKPFPSKALSLTDEMPMMLGGKWGGTHD
jgi:hypothetical protein